ncbi:MAG: histidine triad nucleotide-binding protein [Clostridia bacterium]|nr:histidine triad nucleotide-binding protein [Clostridia bacterium]
MEDCIFCKIIHQEIPSKIVFENDLVIAFEDLNPVAPVHILIVPKKHIKSAMELTEDDAKFVSEVYMVAQQIAKEKGIAESGFRIVNNCGEDAGQTVKHIHFHLIGGKELGTM